MGSSQRVSVLLPPDIPSFSFDHLCAWYVWLWHLWREQPPCELRPLLATKRLQIEVWTRKPKALFTPDTIVIMPDMMFHERFGSATARIVEHFRISYPGMTKLVALLEDDSVSPTKECLMDMTLWWCTQAASTANEKVQGEDVVFGALRGRYINIAGNVWPALWAYFKLAGHDVEHLFDDWISRWPNPFTVPAYADCLKKLGLGGQSAMTLHLRRLRRLCGPKRKVCWQDTPRVKT